MYDNEHRAVIGISGEKEICLIPKMANRHGLVTGVTGTGKTVTLQTLAETFSQMGVSVFASDAKGDLSGVAAAGGESKSVEKRVTSYGLKEKGFAFQSFPTEFWDVFGRQGTPVRATIADMGPLLLSRLLSFNETQTAVLTVIFKVAHDKGLELIDLKDLKKVLEYAAANTDSLSQVYGAIPTASIGTMQRGLLALEQHGGEVFFGEPALSIHDFIRTVDGKGVVNILAADSLMQSPQMYTTFLLWLMTKLFDVLPEAGDLEKPKLVFFFDEAHLLFRDAPKALLDKVEQVVRLIRSKGVGIYFITQSPSDIPDAILGQLGNRIQHALRAYTPKDQKALKAAAQSFRANPLFDTETVIGELEIGEALISFLDAKGAPEPVERAFIVPPQSHIGPLPQEERTRIQAASELSRRYAVTQDRNTAFEVLNEQPETTMNSKERAALEKTQKAEEKQRVAAEKALAKEEEKSRKFWKQLITSIIAPLMRQVINSLLRGVLRKK